MYLTFIICIFTALILYAWVQTLEGNKEVFFYLAICLLSSLLSFKAGQENILPIAISENTTNLNEIKVLNQERITFLEKAISDYKKSEGTLKAKEEPKVLPKPPSIVDKIPK